MTEIWKSGASEIAAKFRARDVSAREVIEAHLARIEATNPRLNAVTCVLAESARNEAERADAALARGDELGPLAGVPMTVKENIDLAGSATTQGLVALKDAIAPFDAPHIRGLRAAGAIPIARTNLPDLASRWHTDNALHGATLNPWHPDHTTGGSSGGDAAALAAGMTPLGMGNDIAGSLRWPSQCCGTVALKPSLGRIPLSAKRDPLLPFAPQLLAVQGPMARRVADLRLAFGPMCADDGNDVWHVPAPLQGPPLARRVAVVTNPGGRAVHPDVADGVTRAADALVDAGYDVAEGSLPGLDRASEIYFQIMGRFGAAADAPMPLDLTSKGFQQFWAALQPAWENASGEAAFDPLAERRAIAWDWSEAMRDRPLILAPVATLPAFDVTADQDGRWLAEWLPAIRPIVVVNLLGLPAVAVPTGVTNGLPQGVQIIGPRFREDACLDAAEAIEARLEVATPIDPRPAR